MKRLLKLGLMIGLLLLMLGCVGKTAQREAVAGLKVIKEPTTSVWVSDAEVFNANGQLVVLGKVHAAHDVKQHGHVDVCFATNSGEVVKKAVKISGLLSKRRGATKLAFKAVFDRMPEEGSTVKVKYHRGSSDCEGDVSCNS